MFYKPTMTRLDETNVYVEHLRYENTTRAAVCEKTANKRLFARRRRKCDSCSKSLIRIKCVEVVML